MGKLEESAKLRTALEAYVRRIVRDETRSCMRSYNAVVTSAPNGQTMGVRLFGDDNIMNVPYMSTAASAIVGNTVLLVSLYDNLSSTFVLKIN